MKRAQAHKFKDLSKTFLCADNSAETEEKVDSVELKMCALPNVDLPFGKNMLFEKTCYPSHVKDDTDEALFFKLSFQHPFKNRY